MTIALQGLVVTVAVSSLVLLYTSSSATLEQLRDDVHWQLVPFLALPVLLSWTCNGLRFYLMTRCIGHPLSLRRAGAIAVSTEFGVAATPGGVGGSAVRLGLLKKSGISYVHGGSLLAADVFLDILFFTFITPFAFYVLLRYLPTGRAAGPVTGIPLWLLLLPLLPLTVYALRKRIYRRISNLAPLRRYRLAGRIRLARRKLVHGFRQGKTATALIFRRHRGALVLNFLLSAVQFSSRYSVLPLAIWMLGVPLNPLPLILIQGVLFMVSILVFAPGGGGSVELLAALALPRFMPVDLVGVAILLWRLFNYHFYLLAGGAVFATTIRRLARQEA